MSTRLALYSPASPGLPGQPFGKDVANFDLFRALARFGEAERVTVMSHGAMASDALHQALLGSNDAARPEVSRLSGASVFDAEILKDVNVLVRGTPDLANLAWQRRELDLERAYSLVGLVHTIAPPALRRVMAEASVAPLQPWDALVCTSPTVQANLQEMFEGWDAFLRARFGEAVGPPCRPSLPLVPLGVDAERIAGEAGRPGRREALRARLRLDDDDVLVLWLGRLSFFEKAFPQPMFQAVERAQRLSGRRIAFALVGWFPGGESDRTRYMEAARLYAPSVAVFVFDGSQRDAVNDLLAGTDIFLSLVDNIQETFGLAPVEAMAAGLPVVASDWDGYRYTIEHGRQGYLIPTLGAPPGTGNRIHQRHVFGLDSYQAYVGQLAQQTAVNVEAAAAAIARLAADPDLRRTMGEAGRARVAAKFAWPVVVGELAKLFDELARLRAEATGFGEQWPGRADPVRAEPFTAFAGFATSVLGPETRLYVLDRSRLDAVGRCDLDRFGAVWRSPEPVWKALIAQLENGPRCLADLIAALPQADPRALSATIMWLAKLGVLAWDR